MKPLSIPRDIIYINKLTPVECKVATEILNGLSNPEVAKKLNIHSHSVVVTIGSVYHKMGFSGPNSKIKFILKCGLYYKRPGGPCELPIGTGKVNESKKSEKNGTGK